MAELADALELGSSGEILGGSSPLDRTIQTSNTMTTPTHKSEELEQAIEQMFHTNRKGSIENHKCVNPPIGCGGEALNFADKSSYNEYCISGLCQKCQDSIF